ncbi:XRE family transcriptional regulator [Mycobacterium avium]|uniref:XRE family transcriptional regulator n=1 Tax=Mycobacterium avium TaxID=1764 RepID=UPI001F37B43F|nr:XRE family transcriptional regulator [Mycobacterium avium]
MSQAHIARIFGVSRQAVHDMCVRYGIKRETRQELLTEADVWPYKVSRELSNQYLFQLLRYHAQYMLTQGKGMTKNQLARLRAFHRKLRDENQVVEYDPDIPPEPGVSPQGGFAYRKRRKSDRGLIIRVNGHTNITEQGREIWVFPDQEP